VSTAPTAPPQPVDEGPARHRHAARRPLAGRAATIAAALVVCAAAMVSGLSMGGDNKGMVVLPLAAVIALGVAALALTRFAPFVLLLLGTRSSIDLFKLSGSTAGNTATNNASRGLDPSSLLALLFLAASALWLLAQYSNGRRLKGSPLRIALACLVAACAVSIIGSEVPSASALEALRILSWVMMFVVLEQLIVDRRTLVKVLYAAYAGLLFPLGYTLALLLFGEPPSEVQGSFTRITGPFAQSNTFARYLAFMIVFGVAINPALSRRQRRLMVPVLALSATFLVMTLTRGAILAVVVAVVVVALVQRRKGVLVGFAATALLAVVLVPGLGARFATLGAEPQLPGGPETGNSLEWRLRYWSEVLPLANSNPVTGIGLNMTQYQTSASKQPHNDFIRAYVETGVVGLLAYLAMHVLLVRNAVVAMRNSVRGTFDHAVAAGALGCAVCFLLGSAGANVMSNVVSLWYLAAFSAAGSYVARRNPVTGRVDGLLPLGTRGAVRGAATGGQDRAATSS
jgi:putative inorganic carbon (hco3(-)) transporter